MCGIVGYIGSRPAVALLVNGLKRLEYRGYDSAGVAVWEDGRLAEDVIWVPPLRDEFSPLANVVALQLLAYYSARARGTDIDQPRNLAKSVTVE